MPSIGSLRSGIGHVFVSSTRDYRISDLCHRFSSGAEPGIVFDSAGVIEPTPSQAVLISEEHEEEEEEDHGSQSSPEVLPPREEGDPSVAV